ncbi:hypothetical protein [Actinomadura rubrisoli]|uniref:Scaffolding protein n=1 Tax=Actinomadura rubrisoli TaxID=2530368 RepID=A0A4R5BZ91_9ACTN|nr:hypothetical protein [Actinomadura rubrisoli]TDD90780.1 hypothetical protein E1298_12830 [Actinomadura rubrisoli]
MYENPSTTPGAIIGYRKNGLPIRLIAGGNGEGGDGGNGDQGGTGTEGDQDDDQRGQDDGQASSGGGTGQDAGTAQQGDKDGSLGGDVASLPAWAQKLIRDTRGEAAGHRTKAKDFETKHQGTLDAIAKALGLKTDDAPPNPAKLAEELTKERSSTRAALVELAVYKNAGKHGADPGALGDSRSFLSAVDKLDPAAEDFATKLAAEIKKAVEANPKLKASNGEQSPPSRSGGDFAGGTGGKNDASSMSVDDFRKARQQRRS